MTVSLSGRATARGLALVSAMLLSSAAFAAPDANKVAADLVAAAQAKGDQKASFDSASASGDVVTITNFKITSPKGGDALIPSVVVTNPVDRQPGGFTAASIAADDGSVVRGNRTVTWKQGIVNDAVVPAPSEVHQTAKITPFSHFGLTDISITGKDMPTPVTIQAINLDLSDVVYGVANNGKVSIAAFAIPTEALRVDAQSQPLLEQLGYTSLLLNIDIGGAYDQAKQEATISNITIDAKDMGKLNITGSFGGISREKLQNMDGPGDAAETATLEAATIRFDDAGLTNRVLDMQAKSMGTDRSSLAMMLPAALPLAFTQFNITDQGFQQKVVGAVGDYLKDPKSITISVKPAEPVLLMDLGKLALSSPQTLPARLAVDIEANN